MKTEPFECRSTSLAFERLVLGWPADKWPGYQHRDRPQQIEKGIALALTWLMAWVDGTRRDFPGVLVYGGIGVGKSAGVLQLAVQAARRGCSAQFVTVEHVLTEFNSTEYQRRDGDTKVVVRDRYMAPTVLILDEMCARFYTDKERAFLLDLIRDRQREGKPTLVTTNLLLNTTEGEDTFTAFFDGRALSTFKGWRVDAGKWGPSLRGRDDGNTGVEA